MKIAEILLDQAIDAVHMAKKVSEQFSNILISIADKVTLAFCGWPSLSCGGTGMACHNDVQ